MEQPGHLFTGLLSHYLHQNTLAWQNINTLITFHAIGLPVSYYLGTINAVLSIIVLVVLLLSLFFICIFFDKLRHDRDINLKLFDEITEYIMPPTLKPGLSKNRFGGYISFSDDNAKILDISGLENVRWLDGVRARFRRQPGRLFFWYLVLIFLLVDMFSLFLAPLGLLGASQANDAISPGCG